MKCLVVACIVCSLVAANSQRVVAQETQKSPATGETTPGKAVGWRGDGSGRYPNASPVTQWERRCSSPVTELRYKAGRPKGNDDSGAKRPASQSIVEWLAIGPFGSGEDALADEKTLSPDEGDKYKDKTWSVVTKKSLEEVFHTNAQPPKDLSQNGFAAEDSDRVDIAKKGDATGQFAYTHCYLHSPSDAAFSLLLNSSGGLKIWVNGLGVCDDPAGWQSAPPNGYDYDAFELHEKTRPGEVPINLKKGWNRLLFKVLGSKKGLWLDLRLSAPSDATYKSKNIVWETKLPSMGNSTPIIVGDQIFMTSEVNELISLDRSNGKILWRRSNSLYDATPQEERASSLLGQAQSINDKLTIASGWHEIAKVNKQLQELLDKADPKKYVHKQHLANYCKGNATPTPCSDGRNVLCYFTNGVAACYDLKGNRKWIKTVRDIGSLHGFNTESPVIIGDKFILYRDKVRALDVESGKELWTAEGDGLVGDAERPSSLLAARLYGVDVVFGTSCRVYRASDGKILQQRIAVRDCSPVMAGENVICSANGGNLCGVQIAAIDGDQTVKKDCHWEDSHTDTDLIASPLYDKGLIYTLNQRGTLVVWELSGNSARIAYKEPMNMLHPAFHCWSARLGCVASPALGGRYIYLMDNQGTTVVIEPGKEYKQVAISRIENFLARDFIVNTQETFSACPVFEGKRIYIRGEDMLYCIGEK